MTVPAIIEWRAEHTPDNIAYRYKDLGIWHNLSWKEVFEMIMSFAAVLKSLGVKKGDKVGLVGDNIFEMPVVEVATHVLGGISVGLYQNALSGELAELLDYTDVSWVFAENQEQADKINDMKFGEETDRLPQLKGLIYQDSRGMEQYDDEFFLEFDTLLEKGRELYRAAPEEYLKKIRVLKPDDVCHFSLTSGTSGRSKATMISHKNLITMGVRLAEVDHFGMEEEYVSFLPFAWIGEQMITVGLAPVTGITVNFPESPESLMNDLKEIGPHVIFSSPKMWENFQTQIWIKISETYWLNKSLYNFFMKSCKKSALRNMRGESLSFPDRLIRWFGILMIFRPVLNALGILRLKQVYTGGAALGPDLFTFFHTLGINLKQIYGQTESTGIAYLHRDGDIKHDTVGIPLPGTEFKISESGEILTRSDSVCKGYYKRPEDTAELIEDGWLHSGDAGYIDNDGHLVVIDRVSDVMRNSSGEIFSPMLIENKLKFSPFIKEAAVFGNEKDYIACFINVDPDSVSKWAEMNGIAYTTYMDLSSNPKVIDLILSEIREMNKSLDKEHMHVHRFLLLPKLLDPDDEELTRTGKLRRNVINKNYEELIDALYDKSITEKEFHMEFRFQDGNMITEKRNILIIEAIN